MIDWRGYEEDARRLARELGYMAGDLGAVASAVGDDADTVYQCVREARDAMRQASEYAAFLSDAQERRERSESGETPNVEKAPGDYSAQDRPEGFTDV